MKRKNGVGAESSSQYIGVMPPDKRQTRISWRCEIMIASKAFKLGTFQTELDAARAVDLCVRSCRLAPSFPVLFCGVHKNVRAVIYSAAPALGFSSNLALLGGSRSLRVT